MVVRILEQGPNWYVTDKPCKRGHVGAKRNSYNGQCMECVAMRRAEKLADPEFKKKKRAQQKALIERNEELRERRKLYSASWFKKNPVRAKELRHKRRTLSPENGVWPSDLIELLLSEQGNNCPGCLKDVSAAPCVDHVIALKLGGPNSWNNLQLLCRPCNSRKGSKSMLDWLQTLEI